LFTVLRTHPLSAAATVSRRELFLWATACLAGYALIAGNFDLIGGVEGEPETVGAKSVFQFVAWYASIQLLFESETEARAVPADLAVALVACFAPVLIWTPFVTGTALTAVGLYLWATSSGDSKLKAAAVILVALSVNIYWAPKIFEIVSLPLLRADAAFVAALLSLSVPDVAWSDTIITSAGHSIGLYGPCSSFHNISLGLLCWITVTKLIRSEWMASDLMFALAITLAVLVLNTARLALMAHGQATFDFWHDGMGGVVFAWFTTATVVGLSLWGASRRAPVR
jgi:hypothetical protein